MNIPGINEEIERIIKEVLMSSTDLEKFIVKREMLIMINFMNLTGQGFSARTHRLVHEIFHRYYCLAEGLEKK